MRRLFVIASVLMAAAPAKAELAPEVYAQARAEAVDVVVIRVESISGLPWGRSSGRCAVSGIITSVERGHRREGERIELAVPCIGRFHRMDVGPWPGFLQSRLRGSATGRAFLDDAGLIVRRGYDILS